ncbi:MAG: hypothetical protein M3320_02030 [Actinomycetota bacterium]|nr:hypothetical protein [Actinomycetota bacterium]
MKRLPLVPVALLALLCAPAAAPASHFTTHGKCAVRGSQTIERNEIARVYERRNTLFGCFRLTGAKRTLARSYDDGYVTSGGWESVVLNETYVAWIGRHSDVSCKADCPPGHDGESEWIGAIDLRTRSRRSVFYGGRATALAISATGGLAYLIDDRELWVADGGGRRLVASGPFDQPFELVGSLLRWYPAGGRAGQAYVYGGTTCQPRAGRTVAWNDVVRAYEHDDPAPGALYGCTWTRSRPVLLTTAPHAHVETAGRFVAWTEGDAVVLHDMLFGREVRPAAGGPVHEIAVGGEGVVAWLAGDTLYGARGTVPVELARGAIEPGSLRVHATVVFWRQDGAERSTRVGG